MEVSPEESLAPSSAAAVVPVAAPAYVAPAEHQVPEWFKKGQEQAKKPAKEKPDATVALRHGFGAGRGRN